MCPPEGRLLPLNAGALPLDQGELLADERGGFCARAPAQNRDPHGAVGANPEDVAPRSADADELYTRRRWLSLEERKIELHAQQ